MEQNSTDRVTCPKCRSDQITANKKGFGVGKAAAGAIATGGVGLLAGFIGSRKIQVTCIKCGYAWTAGGASSARPRIGVASPTQPRVWGASPPQSRVGGPSLTASDIFALIMVPLVVILFAILFFSEC